MENNNKYLVIYHKEDNDGVFSAGIFLNYIKTELNAKSDNIVTLGVDYNELNEFDEYSIQDWQARYDEVIMLDISFNDWKKMKYLYDTFGTAFTWVDHHAPIIRDSMIHNFNMVNGVRNTHASTIVLLYKYLYNPMGISNIRIPYIYQYLSAWDSWTYAEEDKDMIYKFNLGVTSMFRLNLNAVEDFINKEVMTHNDTRASEEEWFYDIFKPDMIRMGTTIANYEEMKYENLIYNYGDSNWRVGSDNRTAVALFIQGPSNSLMFDSIKDTVKNGIVFKKNPNDTWGVSLYNTKNDNTFHCGTYLKNTYKTGGGHEGAGGAILTQRQFNKVLKNKHL